MQTIVSPIRRTALKAVLGGFSAFTAYEAFYQFQNYLSKDNYFKNIQENLTKFQPIELKDFDAVIYPWLREPSLKNWEYKLVKIQGYFKEERFFIRRERGDQDGYLVFAPFVTAIIKQESDINSTINPPREHSIFVNLGWVPLENKSDIERGNEPVPLLEQPENPDELFTNPYTGLSVDQEQILDEDVVPLTEITGLIRRGEQENILHKRRNWKYEGVFTSIDLNFMARFFRLYNIEAASTAYIERLVPSYEGEDQELYPVPASIKNYDKPILGPKRHLDYSFFWGATSAVSLLSYLTLLKR